METKAENQQSPPLGHYTLIGVDIDTTGRRLIDEIVHLAAYTPTSQFTQYIMPVMNLNPAASQRHQIRVITIGFFRMLKNMQSYKFIKTKTEIAALRDFLDWLEERKKADQGSNGVILMYHEQWKFIPYMLLEAMKKYDLLDRYLGLVKYIANGYALAEAKCSNTVKSYSLRQLSKVLLNHDDSGNPITNNNGGDNKDVNNNTENVNGKDDNNNNNNNENANGKDDNNTSSSSNSTNTTHQNFHFEGNASVRAKLTYETVHHLAKGEQENFNEANDMLHLIRPYTTSSLTDIGELQDQNKCLDRQNSLRTIFVNYFKTSKYYRVRGVTFRRVLAEHGYDLPTLQEIWGSNKKDGLKDILSTMESLKLEERDELADLLDCHFDPDKENVKPLIKKHRKPRRVSRSRRGGPRDTDVKSRNGRNSQSKSPGKKRDSQDKQQNSQEQQHSQDGSATNKDLKQHITVPEPLKTEILTGTPVLVSN